MTGPFVEFKVRDANTLVSFNVAHVAFITHATTGVTNIFFNLMEDERTQCVLQVAAGYEEVRGEIHNALQQPARRVRS